VLAANKIVAFVPTNDPARAKAFYGGTLGLRFVSDDGFALVFDANGIMLRVAWFKDPDGNVLSISEHVS
jgi:catechol 2,3-dioxygenase-like lactoylglutathione lyase family enzyme